MNLTTEQPRPAFKPLELPWSDEITGLQGWRLDSGNGSFAVAAMVARGTNNDRFFSKALDPRQQERSHRFTNASRREEYSISRGLLACLLATEHFEAGIAAPVNRAISHCRHFVAVAIGPFKTLAIDVECRLPRHRAAVAQRLGWPDQFLDDKRAMLFAWTAWEALCKSRDGSVLNMPDERYQRILVEAGIKPRMSGSQLNWRVDDQAWLSGPVTAGAEYEWAEGWFTLVAA